VWHSGATILYEGVCVATDPINVPIDETLYPPDDIAVDPIPGPEKVKKAYKKIKNIFQ